MARTCSANYFTRRMYNFLGKRDELFPDRALNASNSRRINSEEWANLSVKQNGAQ